MDALQQQQDQYIEKQIKPQIEDQLKDIEIDNEDDKLKEYKQTVSNKQLKHGEQNMQIDYKNMILNTMIMNIINKIILQDYKK